MKLQGPLRSVVARSPDAFDGDVRKANDRAWRWRPLGAVLYAWVDDRRAPRPVERVAPPGRFVWGYSIDSFPPRGLSL